MTDTLLAAALTAAARRIGEGLPAAYNMSPSQVVVAGDLTDHVMPEDAIAVRWSLGAEDSYLVVALTPDAAGMLQAGPPEVELLTALQACVDPASDHLVALFDSAVADLGDPEQVDAANALADGPGDAVSVQLRDGDVHRATVGLRLVVTDSLLGPAPAVPLPDASDSADEQDAADQATDGAAAPTPSSPDATEGSGQGPDAVPASGQEHPTDGQDGDDPRESDVQATPGIVGSGRQANRQASAGRAQTPMPQGEAHPADWASFDHLRGLPGSAHSMALLADVELGVTAELGRTELTVRDVLGLTPGAIIELDRAAGSPVDVVVNGTLIARGEVVVIDEEFGIRITEILGMQDEANPFPVAQ